MKNIPRKHLEDFVAAAHRIAEYGLVLCGSGNLSSRADDDRMLVTGTNSWMVSISIEEVAVCRIEDGATLNGENPSKEIGFHAAILRERADVNVVLHFQSPCATTLACRQPGMEDFSVIPEIPYYIGPVAAVPYLPPGSPELADAVASAVLGHELAILCNHGQVVVGESFDQVVAKAMYFELACKIILGAAGQVQYLPEEAIADQRRKGNVSRTNVSS